MSTKLKIENDGGSGSTTKRRKLTTPTSSSDSSSDSDFHRPPHKDYSTDEDSSTDEEEELKPAQAVTITDMDVFKCPVCIQTFRIPVHQCVNGHMVCDSCCQKIINKCPTCSTPINQRCFAIEKVLAAVQVSCKNQIHGCKHKMKFCDKPEHEDSCAYTRCSCPVNGCNFVNSAVQLYHHFGIKHVGKKFGFNVRFSVTIKRETRSFILTETISRTIFVLKQFIVLGRRAVSVVLIASKSSRGKFRCHLEAKNGEATLSLESAVASVTNLVDFHPTKYMLVVEDFHSTLGEVVLQIRIRQAGVKGNSTK